MEFKWRAVGEGPTDEGDGLERVSDCIFMPMKYVFLDSNRPPVTCDPYIIRQRNRGSVTVTVASIQTSTVPQFPSSLAKNTDRLLVILVIVDIEYMDG